MSIRYRVRYHLRETPLNRDHEDTSDFMTDAQVQIHIHPGFGEWIDLEVTPEMVRGKLLWITTNISRVRKDLVAADRAALAARHEHEDALIRAIDVAVAQGATSKADAERIAGRVVRESKKKRDQAEMHAKHLRDELEELYRAQLPATQSINRIAMAEFESEWRTAGLQP